MASIIDGTTYNGYWKITPDNSSPNAYFTTPKTAIYFQATDDVSGSLRDISGGGSINVATDSSTIDGEGNALNTSEKIATYLSNNR